MKCKETILFGVGFVIVCILGSKFYTNKPSWFKDYG